MPEAATNETRAPRVETGNASRFLEVADRIGRQLCRDAVWTGKRCSWTGWAMEPADGFYQPVYCAAPLSFYNGVAGIALFLARLHRITGDAEQKAALDGAVHLLVGRCHTLEHPKQPSHFSGLLGIGVSLVEIGEISEDEGMIEAGLNLARKVGGFEFDQDMLDVISGCAGTIPVLLDLAKRYDRPALLETAEEHGRVLLEHRVEAEVGYAWPGPIASSQPLLGYSHGASGMACALLELHRVNGNEQCLEAALDALLYERACYSPAHGNWPDLREAPGGAGPTYPVSWCHGATGIGLVRLRALELLAEEDPDIRREAEAAIVAVRRELSLPRAPQDADWCLCHGTTGNAELLLLAAMQLDRPELRLVAEEVGLAGIARYHEGRLPWPCSFNQGGESPDLMLGLAGIGHYYLRLHDPEGTPTVLITRPAIA